MTPSERWTATIRESQKRQEQLRAEFAAKPKQYDPCAITLTRPDREWADMSGRARLTFDEWLGE